MAISTVGVNGLSSSGLSASALTAGRLPSAQMPAGTILQTVSAVISTNVNISTATWTSTQLTASITPTSATSKIYVMIANPMRRNNISGNSYGMGVALYRNGSSIFTPMTNMGYSYPSSNFAESWLVSFNYLDSPATTSSTTYTMYFNCCSDGTMSSCVDNNPATITLMEIAG